MAAQSARAWSSCEVRRWSEKRHDQASARWGSIAMVAEVKDIESSNFYDPYRKMPSTIPHDATSAPRRS